MLMDVGIAQCSGKQDREGFFSVIVHTQHGSDHRLRTKVRRGGGVVHTFCSLGTQRQVDLLSLKPARAT